MNTISFKKKKETPLINQYNNIKRKYTDAILLFQIGDFYEIFGKDAVICSKTLNIVLTRRSSHNNIYFSGFPCHSINTYLPKLINAGYRVAICDQLESTKKGKNIVKRGVVQLVTPGTAVEDSVLKNKSNNFLASIHIEKKMFGLSFLDISTGDFFIVEDEEKNILQYLKNFQPSEIIFQKNKKNFFYELLKYNSFYFFKMEDWYFNYQITYEKLISHFKTNSLKGFGIENLKLGIIASGIILFYLNNKCLFDKIDHISTIKQIKKEEFMWINDYTFRNLEIFKSYHESGKSLLNIIDKTITPMGGRLLKNWMLFPLIDIYKIKQRNKIVNDLCYNNILRIYLNKKLKKIFDIERIITKMVTGRITPREIISFNKSIISIEKIKQKIIQQKEENISIIGKQILNCNYISYKISRTLKKESSYKIEKGKGDVISDGLSNELDNTRLLYFNQKEYIDKICLIEKKKTGISNLKINNNNLFGYCFEIKLKDKDKVPNYWIKKQTLSNSLRYTTQILQNYELNIINAEQKIFFLEKNIFNNLINKIIKNIKKLQNNSRIIAKLDVLCSFSNVALENNYVKPNINFSFNISIKNGRHPVIEKQFLEKDSYIPNDIFLDKDEKQIIIITGPNMSGKSAILRQTAIIILMTHIGSFIPAEKAEIGLTDKIFSRVGSYDNISLGESTFMVEMNETSNILNNITKRSFIILDEIGRGTNNNEGISIAASIIKFLHTSKLRPLTLFATHYNELYNLYNHNSIKNYHISVKKINENVIFMRKLIYGSSKYDSFGIYVAKISGMPIDIINNAKKILSVLKKDKINNKYFINKIKKIDICINKIKKIDILSLKEVKIKIEEIKNLLK